MNQSFRLRSCQSVLVLMVHPYKLLTNEFNLLKVKGHYLVRIATINVLQSSNSSDFSIVLLFLNCLILIAVKASLVRALLDCKLQRERLYDTKWDILFEHLILINVPNSRDISRLISFFTMQKSIAYPNQMIFTSPTFCTRFLVVFNPFH